jgi:hypothetical protein
MRAGWVALFFLIIAGALPATIAAQTSSEFAQGLWLITMKSSLRPEPRTERICLNVMAPPAELGSCAGLVAAPDRVADETISCSTHQRAKYTLSVTTSEDGRLIRDRSEHSDDNMAIAEADLAQVPPAVRGDLLKHLADARHGWAEMTMTSEGACPFPMTIDQPFVVVRPDGTEVDPFRATACMVNVLKTTGNVTAPSVGFVRDPDAGPLPFVRYTYPSRSDHRPTTVTFTAEGDLSDPAKVEYIARMSGLHSPGDAGPDVYGADGIIKQWKDRCGVSGNILFP